ncbi:GNAT family N-acetyltransferase [Brevibacillus borstelensis]|jgi:GNAT superfamily N-acetyltransferase|uniref:GNAT family N-acetyltransferase n=1 Tax=Brevibacillus borstelensis TaxID=45462 RepID=UPI000F0885C0|nr:GNAT family N-acetyltransferase [Brevibacillus borstelensis]MED1884413.1 GNAT family N-acetyltransferase [Brevibacillus borstelensis]MED2008593.1 GNAT family N-acetyltransferase [Brevibacillus borstelensis]RNB61074.1 GNAT family N-acetyltransferase [Brevibacillus borstelensis]GED52514.1 putative N-acetyltransferase YxeL [Brevibacillus borstelensis]
MSDQFRLATVKDAEKLLELIKRAYQTIRELEIEFTAVHADMEMILENLSEHTCFVLEREGRLLATISLRSLVEVTEYPFLYWFAVDPDCKNQGIGSRLLRYVEETVVRDTLHAPCATLATSRKHPWLLSMYERNGYIPFYERDLGHDDKLVFLQKRLIHSPTAASETHNEEVSI